MCESGKDVTVFYDGGSNTKYVTHQAAARVKAKRLNRFTLDVTTMGDVEKTYDTQQYQFTLVTDSGKKVAITAFGMDRITGPISKLNTNVLSKLFPNYDPDSLQRKTTYVDILLGCDHYGLHPKQEVAKCGDNLSIMKGELGVCLQGTHPDLSEDTKYDSNLVKTIHDSKIKLESYYVRLDSHPEFQPGSAVSIELRDDIRETANCGRQVNTAHSFSSKSTEIKVDNFIQGE